MIKFIVYDYGNYQSAVKQFTYRKKTLLNNNCRSNQSLARSPQGFRHQRAALLERRGNLLNTSSVYILWITAAI